MASTETFPLLQLPDSPLLHLLQLLPHTSLANLAASCSYLRATLHSSPSLWRRLTLRPTVEAAATQSLLAMLRRHGHHVKTVKMAKSSAYLWDTQVLGMLASFCPHLCNISIHYMCVRAGDAPLQLPNACLPNLASLTIKMMETTFVGGIEQLGELPHLRHLAVRLKICKESMRKLSIAFSKLHRLRRVSLGWATCTHDRDNEDHHNRASFIPSLLNNNPHLEEVELMKVGNCCIKASTRHKALLERRGVRLVQPAREHLFDSSDEGTRPLTNICR